MTVWWIQNGLRLDHLDDVFNLNVSKSDAKGSWTVFLKYNTPQVRQDPKNLLTFSLNFEIIHQDTPSTTWWQSLTTGAKVAFIFGIIIGSILILLTLVLIVRRIRKRRHNYASL